ncbi:MAG: CPBP family intramembrane metalloprotease [Deltaproteobacteria bacterium]|nr:CPBP family intramembrane metalloprotease [Deltaproteobacteria bacterium]
MLKALLILIVGTLLGAALTTPYIYAFLLYLDPDLPWPFARVFTRVAMLFAVIILIVYRKEFPLRRLKVYFAPPGSRTKNILLILAGIIIATTTTAIFFPAVLAHGKVMLGSRTAEEIAWRLLKTIPAALLIAAIEESFFRVILFERIQKAMPVVAAAAIVSVIYAVVHFLAPVKGFSPETLNAAAGIEYMSLILQRMFLPEVYPAMLGLFFVGMVLSYAVYKTGSIYLALGLHAGWVIAVKMASFLTVMVPGQSFEAGTTHRYYLVSLPSGWIAIAVAGILTAILIKALKIQRV